MPGGAGHERCGWRVAPRGRRLGGRPRRSVQCRLRLQGLPQRTRPPRPRHVSPDAQPPADADGSCRTAARRRLAQGCFDLLGTVAGPRDQAGGMAGGDASPWGPDVSPRLPSVWGLPPRVGFAPVGCVTFPWPRAPGWWLACGQRGRGGRGARHTLLSCQVTGLRSWPAGTCCPGASTPCTASPCTVTTTPGPTWPAWSTPCGRGPPPTTASAPRAPRRGLCAR